MARKVQLRGIGWNHSRAFPPLVATSQRFEEVHPDVEIRWDKRSLHDFGHADLGSLAEHYDLLVIDHPALGGACESGALLTIDAFMDNHDLQQLALDCVGRCYDSYFYSEHLFALPIDAAAVAASYRPDLLQRAREEVPQVWEDVMKIARKGLVVMPGFHADVFLNFMALCVSLGGMIGENSEDLVNSEIGLQALQVLRELASTMNPEIDKWNPIAVYEMMASTDRFAYCPCAFAYSNYSRNGFATNCIIFTRPPSLSPSQPFRPILGGTGMAISAGCKAPDVALHYIRETAGAEWQRSLYGLSGGQPARLSAWSDELLNQITNGFFKRLLNTVETSYLRPRYPGYAGFQEKAGKPIVRFLQGLEKSRKTLEQVNFLYRESTKTAPSE